MDRQTPEAGLHAPSAEVDHLPLSPEQRAVVATEGRSMRVALVELDGVPDVALLRTALDKVAARHDSLRHGYVEVAGYRGPRLAPEAGSGWQWQAEEADADAVNAQVASWRGASSGMRAALWRVGPDRALLGLAVPALAADSASMRILVRDLKRGYDGSPGDKATIRETLAGGEQPFAYTEYIEWRRELDEEADASAARAYWTQYLAPYTGWRGPALRYRDGAGRAAVGPAVGGVREDGATAPRPDARPDALRATMDVDGDLVANLRDTASRLRLPLSLLMQAAWWATLGRIAGDWRFLGGWQHDCRVDYEMLAGAVGAYEKTLPIALDWEAGIPFSQCAAGLAATLARHVEAQEYWPVDAPPTAVHLEAGFHYVEEPELAGVSPAWSPREMPGPAGAFDMALQVGMRGDGARLTLAYHALRYPAWGMHALLDQYAALLDHVAREPDTPIGTLRVLGAAARRALLAPRGDVLNVGPDALPQLIAQWARRTPEAVALREAGRELSYAELEQRVRSTASALSGLGARRGGIVALRLPRDADLVVVMLAAWRCGAAYLPMEPDWPDARCGAIVRAAAPDCLLVASDDLAAGAAAWASGVPVCSWPAISRELAGQRAMGGIAKDPMRTDGPLVDASALDEVAYVLFTSGSTGEPKGVPIAHGHLLNYAAAATHAMDLGRARRWALTGTVAADLGNTALFGALYNGGTLVVATPDDMRDGASFRRFLATERIDGIKIVPSHLEALLDHEGAIVPACVVLGGEASSAALVRRIAGLAPGCRLYNHYGPTESTVGVMVHAVPLPASNAGAPASLPLTRVLANCHVRVLDADLQPTPIGGIGEVYLGGAQLCSGYLGRDGAGSFIDDPYRPGERLYRSGDLACVLPGGAIQLAGRADHQVKIRGHRVEPAEIETRLLALPDVRQAAVIATPAAGGVALTAFVVCASHDADRIAAWREALAATLPESMIPAHFVQLDAFPRLPNGKIDRQVLAASARATAGQGGGSGPAVAPRDALETVVARRMADLLDRPMPGIDDDFFSMGGHSLLVIKLVTRLRKALKVELPPGAVFDHPTVAALAAELRRRADDPAALDRVAEARMALDDMSPQERAALAGHNEERA
ncbi:Carrier domain-containing protein [Bordetella sputigena]|uniref:non-ribosomal peptide synthetase n=1 Tax=Bordetella sputigena TaxID=1416810 RepID=UPI0039F0166E